jgi:L-asparaginase
MIQAKTYNPILIIPMVISMKITFITTGGTIDKDYPKGAGAYGFEIGEPAVGRLLAQLDPNFEYEIKSVLKKDSLDITNEDRHNMVDGCKNTNTDKIIITHGSDSILATARELDVIKDKTIILVGSFRPEWFKDSNAQFNIGFALGAIGYLVPGVYVAMHGQVFRWDRCTRDEGTGRFVEL